MMIAVWIICLLAVIAIYKVERLLWRLLYGEPPMVMTSVLDERPRRRF